MKRLQMDEKQQKRIEVFFKEETTYFPDHAMSDYAYYILAACSLVLLLPPLRLWEGDKYLSIMGPYLYIMGVALSTARYSRFKEKLSGKILSVSQLLCYLPVERTQLMLFRIRKMLKRTVPYTAVVMLIRCGISLGVYHTLSVWDFVQLGGMLLFMVLVEVTRR